MSQSLQPNYASTVTNSNLPGHGELPRAMPFNITFNGTITSFGIDLTLPVQQNLITGVQSIYVDNSASTVWTQIYVPSSQQTIKIPARSQAYLPLVIPNPPQFQVSNLGTCVVELQLMNFPMPACVWNTGTA